MSEIANSEGASEEKPVLNDVKFPPFPEPTDQDFDEDIPEEERIYYKNKFKDLNTVKNYRLHCSSCDRHMGCSARNERIRSHPMLRTLVCHSCHTFYNSGEFEKGDDGSELYCRWCGQGGQVYCCSDCPHVFCAKCIKRNLGAPKIKEIENADDWKCFKCKPECLKDLRAICWAVLRYCDLKNKMTYQTQDPDLKVVYQKECALDPSECCKHRNKRKSNDHLLKKKDIKKDPDVKAVAANIISKMPATIQVKKFASVYPEDSSKADKKPQKRSASPRHKTLFVKNPISINPCTKVINPVSVPPLAKKIRLPNPNMNTPIRFPNVQERKTVTTYTRLKPKATTLPIPIVNNCFNGFTANVFHCPNPINDNINLSLESLTQGLDMAALSTNSQDDDDVVCTPDFPLEPLCEVTEDNDDDVQCITPAPVAIPKMTNPPPLVPRSTPLNTTETPTSENIIQMTDNDVTVNESTGGLKFRVDPQTLSSNKMYRLPDGRIFAINANPSMPGGYSATIVAVTEANKTVPKGATFAAKLSSITSTVSTTSQKTCRTPVTRFSNIKRSAPKILRQVKTNEPSTRECDLNVPVEWYRYNLIDAVDALEYSLSRLNKLKKEATSVYLRTRSVNEMRNLHRTLERLLNTSSSRFNEIRENLNKGLKQYVLKKAGGEASEDDDDVEILPDIDDDPIFIDENSMESNTNGSENQEVDLTGPGSEFNDSGESRNDNFPKGDVNPLNVSENDSESGQHDRLLSIQTSNDKLIVSVQSRKKTDEHDENKINGIENTQKNANTDVIAMISDDFKCDEIGDEVNGDAEESPNSENTKSKNNDEKHGSDETGLTDKADIEVSNDKVEECSDKLEDVNEKNLDSEDKILDDPDTEMSEIQDIDDKIQGSKTQDSNDKTQDAEMSQEMIETLLKDDNSRDNATNSEDPESLQGTE